MNFGAGSNSTEKEICRKLLPTYLQSLRTASGAARTMLCVETIGIFEQASRLWGNLKRALSEKIKEDFRAWPLAEEV